MPLNASEKSQIAQAFLKCFGEDAAMCGRALRFISQFSNNNMNLLADVQNAATTWQPFIDSGLSVEWWKGQVAFYYNRTNV